MTTQLLSEFLLKEVLHMYAIIETGGKQYKVAAGDTVYIEKLPGEVGTSHTFDKVIAVGEGGESVSFGAPYVAGAKVEATVVKHGKGKKIIVLQRNSLYFCIFVVQFPK